ICAAGGKYCRRVINRLAARVDHHRNSAQGSCDRLRHSPRFVIAFNGEDHALQFWNHLAAECLHRVKRACGGVEPCEPCEDSAVKSCARMQNDFALALRAPNFGERAQERWQHVIRRSEQNQVCLENVAGDAAKSGPAADGSDRRARSCLRSRDDSADSPSSFAKALSQSSAYASRADDGNSSRHTAWYHNLLPNFLS